MPSKLTTILDAIPSDDYTVGGESWNQLVKILKNINVESEESDLTINTTIRWQSGKLVLLDSGAPSTHSVTIDVENIVDGDPRHLTVRAFSNTTDYIATELEAQVLLKKTLGNSTAGTEAKFGRAPDFQGYDVDNIGKIKIRDLGARNISFVEVTNTDPNTYFEVFSNYNATAYPALAPATDIKIRFGYGSDIDEYAFWSQSNGINEAVLKFTQTLMDIGSDTVNFNNATIQNISLSKTQIPSTVVHTDQNNTYSDYNQLFRNTRMRIRNPANTFSMILDVPAIAADRTVSFPLITANDTFVLQGIANVFTTFQKIQYSSGAALVTYRPLNTVGQGSGITFNLQNASSVEGTYGAIYGVIADNTASAEHGSLSFQVKVAGTIAQRMSLSSSGILGIGGNQAFISPTSLTTNRTFTLPDVTGNFVIDSYANVFTNKQKIQWNGSNDQLKLFRGSAAATSSLAGVYFSALNNASAEISYANILGGSGSAAADIVAGTEKGQILMQILESGALANKLQMRSTTLETFGMVPDFTVGSGDFNSMYIYRPINSAGSNLINFNLQNVSSVEKTFGYIGIRSETLTASAEVGSVQLGAMVAGSLALQAKIQSYQTFLYNSSGFAAIFDPTGLTSSRIFTWPNVAGQSTVNEAQQTLLLKTLTAPVITDPTITGVITLDATSGNYVEFVKPFTNASGEVLMKWRLTEDTNSYIDFLNATSTNGLFVPMIRLKQNTSAASSSGWIVGEVHSSFDTGTIAGISIGSRLHTGAALAVRPILSITNGGTAIFTFNAASFDMKTNKMINATINLDEITLKHTSAAAGDVIYYDGTRFNRKAQGSNNQFLGVVGGVLGYYTFNASAVLALAALTDDVNVVTPADGEFLVYNGTTNKWRNLSASSLGEVNTASNTGSAGVGLFKQKSTYDLQFYKIASADNKLTVALSGTDFLQLTVNEANMSIANMTGSIGNARITDLAWGKLTSVPTSFTPSAHASSHLSNGTDPIAIATTTIRGTVELATDGETAANVVVQGSDSRLADARTPTTHAASHLSNGSDAIAQATTTVRGTVELATDAENAANVVVQGNDSRLSNARTPTTHQSTHALDGSDPFVLKGVRVARQLVNTTPVTLNEQTAAITHVDASGGARTVNLPAAASKAGQIFWIQKIDSSANAVTIDANLSETINGNLTMLLTAQYQTAVLFCDGANWTVMPYSNVRRGKSTGTGNGSATVFNIPHGLGAIPHDCQPTCRTHTIATYTADATNIIVTLSAAPANAASVIFDWSAVP